ncbi:GatB/YqeY domain-containing protein [Desulfurivibrio dismutans]|uniref:GatB/YqeY domain-containing protein n=1 Tax=Desulfurivibrio dismutans TaxID=1398908 RepID=UPI0023DBB8E1|nr:GatB/YqeY domain-containing protein [Desulfurivibrio alkaliphilus]MDF1613954.1 GatB/YqeY domain-containing protein [Desulfurivibrio alkaliphilus]
MHTEAKAYGWSEESETALLAKLKSDLKQAMRDHDDLRKNTIRQIISEFPKLTVPITLESGKKSTRLKTGEEITNDDILGIISGLVKSEKTTLELQGKASSPYLEVLHTYLPQPAGAEEIEAWIAANIDFSQFKTPLQAMGPIMKHFGKKADGNLVKQLLAQKAA